MIWGDVLSASLEVLLLMRQLICMSNHLAAEKKPTMEMMLNLLVMHEKLHQLSFGFN